MSTAPTIQHYYQTILDRTGSDAEIAGWAHLVDDSGISLQQVQVAFVNSFEALSNVAPIVEMYQAHTGRLPDQAGLAYWVGVLDSGAMSLADIGLTIAGSAESQEYYGTSFDGDFVTALYENILGREPEAGAVDGWLALKMNGMTQAQMQEAFRASAEAGARAASSVTTFLTALAHDDPNAFVGSLFSAGLTYALTTGHDLGAAFTGTPGNDTFLAIEDTSGAPVPTWTTSDAIDGGGGINVFDVTQTAPISGTPLDATVTNIQIANIVDASTVTLDTTDWTGLTALNVTDSGDTDLTVADTTGATVTDTAGTVTITGGASQTVSTSAGDVVLSGATGAIAVTDTAIGFNTVSIDGGSSVDLTITGETDPDEDVLDIGDDTSPTGPVTVTVSSDPTRTTDTYLGTIYVDGGTVVDVTQNVLGAANHTFTAGMIGIQGEADTTSVSATATAAVARSNDVTGVTDNSVYIRDINNESDLDGTITSISASNYTTLGIDDNALTTLNLAGGSGNIIIDNSGLTTPTNTTLDATLDGLTGGTMDDADIYTTLNITTANRDSRLANITFGGLTALTVAGTNQLTLTSTAGLSALTTVTVSGAAGLKADLSIPGTVTAVDTSGTNGASTVTIDGGKSTFTGGDGADSVTLTGSSTKAISLGDGDDSLVLGSFVPTAAISGGEGTDTLSMDSTAAATASGSGTFAGLVTGFEKLILTGATNQVVDLAVLGIPDAVQTHGGNGLTLSNMNSGGTLTLDGAGTAYTIGNTAFAGGVNDTINLVLTDRSSAGVSFAATGITMSGVENIAITTVDAQATPSGTFSDLVTLLGNSSKTITVGGNAGLNLSATSTHLTTVDASGITLGDFTWTAGALASAATVSGSAAGTNTVDFSTATGGAVTYTGGTGDDIITAGNGKNNVIDVGDGDNSVTANGGNNRITSGDGNDTIVVGNGTNMISTGDGSDSVTTGTGTNTITTGTGAKTLSLGSGANTVTLGTHSAGTADSISVAATTTGTYVPTAIITGLNTVGLDTITFSGDSATTFAAFTAGQLISFGDALGNNGTAGSAPPTLAAAVADVLGNGSVGGNLARHGIAAFQYGGNTYLVDQHGTAGTAFGAGDTLVELAGTPTINTTSVSSGVLHLLT